MTKGVFDTLIKVEDIKTVEIRKFADTHDLGISVKERGKRFWGAPNQFYCSFDDCWITDGNMLSGSFGDGETPEAAIHAWCKIVSGEKIKIGKDRYIDVPKLFFDQSIEI